MLYKEDVLEFLLRKVLTARNEKEFSIAMNVESAMETELDLILCT